MVKKCFVNGCKNKVCFEWKLSDKITMSCDIHKILDNNTIANFQPVKEKLKKNVFSRINISKIFKFSQLVLIFFLAYTLYNLIQTQNESTKKIVDILDDIKKTTDINYRFYSEIFKIRDIFEKMKIYEENTDNKSLKNSNKEGSILQEQIIYAKPLNILHDFTRKETLITLSNIKADFNTKLERLSNNLGLFFEDISSYITTISFLESNSRLLIGTLNGMLNICNLQTLQYSNVFKSNLRLFSIALTPDFTTAILTGDSLLRILNTYTLRITNNYLEHNHWILSAIISKDNKWIITGSSDKTIGIWNHETFILEESLIAHIGDVWTVALSDDNKYLISGGEFGMVILWDFSKRSVLSEFKGNTGAVYSVVITMDNKFITSGGADGKIRIWEREKPDEIIILVQEHLQKYEILSKGLWYLNYAIQGILLILLLVKI